MGQKFVIFLAIFVLFMVGYSPAFAVDMTVTVSSPYVANDGNCSLIEAIDNANDDAPTHADCPAGSGADTITLTRNINIDGSTLFPASSPVFFDSGNSGLPEITSDITITGGQTIRRTGAPDFRFFVVLNTGSLTLDDITLRDGRVVGGCDGFSGGDYLGCGGAIVVNNGNLTLTDVTLLDNQAVENVTADFPRGGAIAQFSGALTITDSNLTGNSAEFGGAISIQLGTHNITDTTFNSNTALTSGGGIFQNFNGTLNVFGSTFTGNQVTNATTIFNGGGAIDNAGSNSQLTVVNSEFTGNSARNGGAINNFNASDANITNSTFTNNSATDGGAIHNAGSGATVNLFSSTLSGNTATSDGGAISNGGSSNTGIANIHNSTILNNTANSDGGGISTRGLLTLENSQLDNNDAVSNGGGIFVGSGSGQTVTITGSDVLNNFAGNSGGGLFYTENPSGVAVNELNVTTSTFDNNEADEGGGIYAARTTVNITRSTISNNDATNIGLGGGGGVYFNSVSVVDISNSTISGNYARQDGGGVYINNATTANISSSTIANNTNDSTNGADGIHSLVAITGVVVTDTIVDNNGNRNCIDFTGFGVTDGGNNISSDTTCGFADTGALGIGDGVDPLLDPLLDNGGGTLTHALQPTSPAIDNGSGACPLTDQRGAGRTNNCDIGAFESITALASLSMVVDLTSVFEVSGTIATVTITLDNSAVDSQAVNVTVPLQVSGDASGLGVDYTLSNQIPIGSAQAGQINPIVFNASAGQVLMETFTITAVDDLLVEADELISILADVIGLASFASADTLAVTVVSDDVAPPRNRNNNDEDDETNVTEDTPLEPLIDVFDPAISKLGILLPGELGVVGERLRWDVTVTNRGAVAGNNVIVTDTLRPELRIDRVTTSKGTANVNGQTVTVTIPTLGAGEQVNIAIFTTSLDGVVIIENTACVGADNQTGTACVSAVPVRSLPNTGESPYFRNLLLILGGLLWITIVSTLIHRQTKMQYP